MSKIYFQPHVGKNYAAQDLKIMMLGESHYLWEAEQTPENMLEKGRTFSQVVIEEIQKGGHNSQQTFNNAQAVVTGEYSSDPTFWDNVIFYNYLQGFVGNAALKGHTDKQFLSEAMLEQSRGALFEVLKKHQPRLVIVWGIAEKKMTEWLPHEPWEMADESLLLWRYKEYPQIYFWSIKHPAMAFSYGTYHEQFLRVKELIK